MKKWSDTNKYLLMLAVLLILLIFTMLIGISVGSVQIEPKNIPELLIEAMTCGGASAAGNAEGKAAALAGNGQTLSAEAVILWNIRLPRVLLSVLLGGALAVSGYLLQLFFCNPIAGPYVLGISSGARLVVAIVMISFVGAGIPIGSGAMAAAAFAGSIMSMLIVLAVSERVKSMSV
ncbi:MAG: iron chelate uptake ABC transporter family permease subunit, partial [Eubacteriales bacterium]|nr:iron chelate uptake ABC transporter family permease subunit [Eubacteriales bacterium]